ncbi:MAG: hypothetical protein NTZ17_08875 [Phycisphaerae bacterium]|nr:hypothetical protein [Phycisphaerae bacterium]
MTSAAQVQANRSNAQKSTGPRTPEGKAVVAQNAVRHGLLAKEVVIKGEDPGEFELYRDQMLAELAPAGQMESLLAHRIVGLSWRLRRAERLQAAAFDKLEDQSKPPEWVLTPEQASRLLAVIAETGVQPPDPGLAGPAAGRGAVQDFAQERILDRLLVYERRIEHSLYRTMAELRTQRRLREQEGVPRLTWEAESSCETNPICPGVSSLKSKMSSGDSILPTSHFTPATSDEPPEGGTPNGGGDELCETNPISAGSNAGGTPNGTEDQEPACETKPIRGPGSIPSNTPSEPRRIRRSPSTASESTYDPYLGRWVATSVALSDKDSNQANLGRRE